MQFHIFKEESGLLTFEWIMLVTILVIGIIAGLAAVRDAVNAELSDVSASMGAVDQGYYYRGLRTEIFKPRPGHAQSDSFLDVSPQVQGSGNKDGKLSVELGVQPVVPLDANQNNQLREQKNEFAPAEPEEPVEPVGP